MDIWDSYSRSWRVIWEQIFHILFIRVQSDFPGTSSQVRAIPQHENSSRNSILTTRASKNWPKLRNYEKHDLSDKIASPGSWSTFKLKISLLTQQILWIATALRAPYALCWFAASALKTVLFKNKISPHVTLIMCGKIQSTDELGWNLFNSTHWI